MSRVEPLGGGGMGTVFRAWQDDLGRPVAVKMLRGDLRGNAALREQFAREARVLARLDDPGIVPVYDSGDEGEGPYYVMRLVDGVPVDAFLRGKLAVDVATTLRAVALALEKVHRAGVLHRDLKPENILVEPDGRAVLVDFGLATFAEAEPLSEGLVGTLDYLAPELLSGTPASVASDVYSLGATLYVALAGRVPFAAETLDEKLCAIREEDPPLLRTLRADVPKALQAICLKALERAPENRYASAAEFARDLERFLRGDVVQALPVRSRAMLRRKAELHLADHADWLEQGLIDERGLAGLEKAYDRVLEHDRGLLRDAFSSLSNLLLFVGILISVFGPTLLLLLTWPQQAPWMRTTVVALPAALLAGLGAWRWRAQDRRRAVACLLGAALLCAPFAYTACELVPALRSVTDAEGARHPILPNGAWTHPPEAPLWMHAAAERLHWRMLIAALAALGVGLALFMRTRAAAFVWVGCLAGAGALLTLAPIAGWERLPLAARWILFNSAGCASIAAGAWIDGRSARYHALPFHGLGFAALVVAALTYIGAGVPLVFFLEDSPRLESWSGLVHGLAFTAAGVALHLRSAAWPRISPAAPLVTGFLLAVFALGTLDDGGSTWNEVLFVLGCVAYLCLGLALQHGFLVLLAAIALPIAIGRVAERHLDAVWAWSLAVVVGGALLVLASFRLGEKRARTSGLG